MRQAAKFKVGDLVVLRLDGAEQPSWERANGEVGEVIEGKARREIAVGPLGGVGARMEIADCYVVAWRGGRNRFIEDFLRPYRKGSSGGSWKEIERISGWNPRKREAKHG